MPADSIFLKGSSHMVCEDYAQHQEGFIFLGDGCSSAPKSDIAVRLAFLALRKSFHGAQEEPPHGTGADGRGLGPGGLPQTDLRDLAGIAFDEGLYTTVMCARRFGNRVAITALGDGFVCIARHSGDVEIVSLSYPAHNAPFYPAYALNPAAWESWVSSFPDNDLHIETFSGSGKKVELRRSQPKDGVPWYLRELDIERDEIDFVMICSDGLASFTSADRAVTEVDGANAGPDETHVDTADILRELCAFKNRTGEFLKRRVLRTVERYRKLGVTHTDDFSAAVLSFD